MGPLVLWALSGGSGVRVGYCADRACLNYLIGYTFHARSYHEPNYYLRLLLRVSSLIKKPPGWLDKAAFEERNIDHVH